jgi:hypothetical protein
MSIYYFKVLFHIFGSRGGSVGIATGYGLDDRGVGFRAPVGSRIFFFPRRRVRFCGPLASYPVGSSGSFRGGKEAGA